MDSDNRLEDEFVVSSLPAKKCAAVVDYSRLIFVFFGLNILSSLLFIRFVNRLVYDDTFNIADLHLYASRGFSTATLLSQKNAPGPTSYLWMAEAARLLKGGELLDGRLAVLLSWALLAAVVFIFARFGNISESWRGAFLALLVFPHSVEASATLLTEGPALLFAILGILAWTEFVSRPTISFAGLMLGIAGGLSMGVAVTCRQYYLALLPAAGFLALHQFRQRGLERKERSFWTASVVLSLLAAAVPVLLLVRAWKGFSSPGMVAGAYYGNWHGVGFTFARPTITAFSLLFYLVPLTFPAMWRVPAGRRLPVGLISLAAGSVAGYFNSFLLQPGPLRTFVLAVSKAPGAGGVLLGAIVTVTIYNAIAFGMLLWEERDTVVSRPAMIFALLTIIFFVAEQFGVGGDVPFYDRYILQAAPFMGLLAFALLPRLTYPRVMALGLMSLVSHVMLWRYAFGS